MARFKWDVPKKVTKQPTPLQRAQQEWSWFNVIIKGAIANIARVATQLGYKLDFKSLEQDLLNLNNARFLAKGGTIKNKKMELE